MQPPTTSFLYRRFRVNEISSVLVCCIVDLNQSALRVTFRITSEYVKSFTLDLYALILVHYKWRKLLPQRVINFRRTEGKVLCSDSIMNVLEGYNSKLTSWTMCLMPVTRKIIEPFCYFYHHQVSNISRTLIGNNIVDHPNVVWASPVGVLQLHLHSRLNTWLQWIGQRNCSTRRETFKFWDSVRLMLEAWR